ncbi:hypothetical protein ASPBRDRAFT_37555 [Aspergillus brasiliensis CBS 101740]|uniref:Uncharacterized protein n=1 Tax=Aspergillus brasiliensis (strain CBS 101740 / IMI 381727 / IBT 21946) TaxID=767769 RepID=A0A1L9V3C8_ASPBC|nr:hypothetical protein ASPBRDRAFT_37555 [Aspergillus brasiliensis CBS 101740]
MGDAAGKGFGGLYSFSRKPIQPVDRDAVRVVARDSDWRCRDFIFACLLVGLFACLPVCLYGVYSNVIP